jgi:uncharacterized protein (DUF2141 family)
LIRTALFLVIALVVLANNGRAYTQEALTLTVVVSGATPRTGQALGSLFDSKDTYLKNPIQETIVAIDETGRATLTFDGLGAGTYAVSVIYDEDADGELDTGFLGIPTESIAMSNNAKARFGPPGFEKTRFELNSSKTIEIRFIKAKD